MRTVIVAGLMALTPVVAQAEGCTLDGGVAVAKVEAMNQMILDSDFDGFAAAIKDEMNLDVSDGFVEIGKVFKDGFTGCATVAQRTDVGGMIQNVVVFDSTVGPLFGYWIAIPAETGHRVISFNINTNLDKVMASLR